jgi:hypothetical protein
MRARILSFLSRLVTADFFLTALPASGRPGTGTAVTNRNRASPLGALDLDATSGAGRKAARCGRTQPPSAKVTPAGPHIESTTSTHGFGGRASADQVASAGRDRRAGPAGRLGQLADSVAHDEGADEFAGGASLGCLGVEGAAGRWSLRWSAFGHAGWWQSWRVPLYQGPYATGPGAWPHRGTDRAFCPLSPITRVVDPGFGVNLAGAGSKTNRPYGT